MKKQQLIIVFLKRPRNEIIMECLLGIACKDFVMLAADTSKLQSIVVMKDGE